MNIDKMIDDLIVREAGYVNHPSDKGGPTKYGITLKTLEDWQHKSCTADDVKQLTKAEASEIYKSEYYSHPGINLLPDIIQPVAFDMAVNMGPIAAIKLMQTVIHKMGMPITIDGHIGPMTKKSAIIACNVYGNEVLRNICEARKEFYRDLVDRDHTQAVFLAGWINRANSFLVV